MKKTMIAAAAVAAMLSGPVLGADLPTKAPMYKAPPPVTVFSWTGCYIGVYGGGAWGGSVDTNDPRSQGGTFAAGTFYNVAGGANVANGGAYSYDLGSSAI